MDQPPWPDAVYLGFRAYRLMKVTQSVYIVADCRGDNSLIIDFNTRSAYNMIDVICVWNTVRLCQDYVTRTHGHKTIWGYRELDGVRADLSVLYDDTYVFITRDYWIVMRPRTFCRAQNMNHHTLY